MFFGIVAYESMKESDLQQRIGDKWGGTVVIRTCDSPKGASPSIWWFVLSLFLGATIWGVALTWMVVVRGR
jgi:hypothetical protein